MTPPETTRDATQPTPFEDALRDLVVRAFANDETVEGEWDIVTPLPAAPDWVVAVRKVDSDDESGYDPDLIE